MASAIYERPALIERGSFSELTRQRKRRRGRDGWFGRRRRRRCDDDWDH